MVFRLDQERLEALIRQFMEDLAREEELVSQKLDKKTLDPFIFALEFSAEGSSSWRTSAVAQSLRKARESKIGDLHEQLFGLVPGWEVRPRQNAEPDLVNNAKSIIVEMKSRQDTVKGSSQKDVYDDLLANVNGKYRGYQGIYCYWLNKSRRSLTRPTFFCPPDNKTRQNRPQDSRIVQVDGRLLWAIATRSTAGIFEPYDNLDTIFSVYEQVFECIDKFGKLGLSDEAFVALRQLAKQNFGLA
jgi:hypothetical protein